MKKALNIKYSFLMMTIVISLMSFSLTKDDFIHVQAYDPSGVWDYTVPSDEGDLTGEMTISKEDDEWQITIESDVYGTLELEEVSLVENEDKEVFMDGNVEVEGDVINFEFEFDGDSLEGIVGTPDGDMEMTAERQKKK